MRKAIFMMLLAIVSNSVVAEWMYVVRNDLNYVYASPSTIRKAGDRVVMLSLNDFKAADEARPYMSAMVQSEYECKKEQSRIIRIYIYSGNMGTGKSEKHDDISSWRPLPTGSAVKALWNIACYKSPQ